MSQLSKQISRRKLIKFASLLPLFLFLKPSKAHACPLCFLIDIAIAWAERGAIVEALASNVARGVVVSGLTRSVYKSAFSSTAKNRIVSAIRTTDTTMNALDVLNKLDSYAERNPAVVASYNEHEDAIQAWWVVNNTNLTTINIENTTDTAYFDATLLIKIKDKQTAAVEKELSLKFNAEPHKPFALPIQVKDLESAGVKDIIVEIIEPSNDNPITKTVFVV